MATGITVTNKSTTDISVSVTYDGTDFQKGGSEQWFTLKANGGSDTWNYRAGNQIARVARSQTSGTPVESYLAVPGQTINIY
ncbi:BcekdA [Botrytis cinerea B05.10]|uniref:BcekdA n=2 Tax=Botryotinia fuckeliana TaxID=40559 RepID=A0A384K4A6_BOTFB|nr:BcekdA [Botrytis cinerea B05.10]ATZ57474.1 BcekdA [Botrytis cinerea B05.10]